MYCLMIWMVVRIKKKIGILEDSTASGLTKWRLVNRVFKFSDKRRPSVNSGKSQEKPLLKRFLLVGVPGMRFLFLLHSFFFLSGLSSSRMFVSFLSFYFLFSFFWPNVRYLNFYFFQNQTPVHDVKLNFLEGLLCSQGRAQFLFDALSWHMLIITYEVFG